MTQSTKILELTSEALSALEDMARNRPELWDDPATDFDAEMQALFGSKPYAHDTGLTALSKPSMPLPTSGEMRQRTDRNALAFKDNIPGITTWHMRRRGILVHLSCFHLLAYGIMRWPHQQDSSLANHVLKHYLGGSRRSMTDDNVAGRTLWLAEISERIAEGDIGRRTPQDILQHFAENPEHYHNCTQYDVMKSMVTVQEYARALMGLAKGVNREGSRELGREINRAAGPMLLDALDRASVKAVVDAAVQKVMSQSKYVRDRKYLLGRRNLQVLSLGAGVQSTVMALMADCSHDGMDKPDFAIFADTGWEPPAVYAHLDWLEEQLSFPIVRVNNGNIKDDILRGINPEGRQFIDMPVYVVKDDGKKYVGTRTCTKQYKIKPIVQHLRKHFGIEKGKPVPIERHVDMWLGISRDEASRVKENHEPWITNVYPLLERDMSRAQLYQWFRERYPDRDLPKSACIGCPYHSDATWAEMKRDDPASFQDAVGVEWAMQNVPASRGALSGTAYLHRSRKPLLSIEFAETPSQEEAMLEECEGLCGI